MSDKARKEFHLPVFVVTALVMTVLGVFGWAFIAAGYAHAEEGWRNGGVADIDLPPGGHFRASTSRGVMMATALVAFEDLMFNALSQLPNFPAVVRFSLAHQLWLVILFAVLEGLSLAGGIGLKALERNLAKPAPSPRKKGAMKKYQLNTPQLDD